MQTIILCGGKGTRMREETEYKPKPLVEIGGRPIIWHIMKIYSHYGINDFILCTGYKGYMVKQYFLEMYWRNNDFTLHTDGSMDIEYHTKEEEHWNITIVDTGLETLTGSRLKQVEKYIDGDTFMFTYGDGLSDVNINGLFDAHIKSGKIATLTGVHPVSPFGIIEMEDTTVKSFKEKPVLEDVVNGGFMVLNKKVFDYIPEKDGYFEQQPLISLARDGELGVYIHNGFWMAIDTVKDVERANAIWYGGDKAWKIWN